MTRVAALAHTIRFILAHPINRGRRPQALARFLAWQVRSRVVRGPVVYPWVNGSKFIVRSGETGLTGNIYCGLHEFADMAYVLHTIGTDDVFVDIGANVGSYTILACAARGARGFCFEPVPATFERLRANLELNDIAGRVAALNVGVSDEAGALAFTAGENACNHVLASDEQAAGAVRVEVVPLDTALGDAEPTMIKIDVEGFETRVLRGADATLRKPSLHSVIMELNGSGRRYGFADADVVATMAEYGFSTCAYDPFTRELRDLGGGRADGGNTLFVRDLPRVRARLSAAPKVSVAGVWL